jgi:nucleotidyltransferase/DNA polymerase involved in DNA repair
VGHRSFIIAQCFPKLISIKIYDNTEATPNGCDDERILVVVLIRHWYASVSCLRSRAGRFCVGGCLLRGGRDHAEWRKPVIVSSIPTGQGRGLSLPVPKRWDSFRQPISQAWKLCPRGIYVLPDMDKYARASSRVMGILLEFTDMLEQVSIDEAFLDVTGSAKLFGSGVDIAIKIKARIREEMHLTASVGVAENKFVAKIASDLEKPDGLVVVPPGRAKEFLAPLPIARLWGVGPRTESHLRRIGLERIGQLADMPHSELAARLGKNGAHLWQLAQGIDDREVVPEAGFKSVGHETRLSATPTTRRCSTGLFSTCAEGSPETPGLKAPDTHHRRQVPEADFSTFTRRITLSSPVDTSEKIFRGGSLNALIRDGVLSGGSIITIWRRPKRARGLV